jgi:small conductance mechanosensitive channel
MLEKLISFVPFIVTVAVIGGLLWGVHWLLIKRHPEFGSERKFSRQLIMIGLTIIGIIVSVLVLPMSDSSRNQLLTLIGLILSGLFAFSSSTVIANLMGGVLMRITTPFRVGDFIRIGDYFGRVSERGLFDTEVQTESRELISLPNSYCMSKPVTTTRSSGTIISSSLSLGYDLDHRRIESLLIEAAETSGLVEPFVHILELGNFSVTYRVAGLLEDPKHLISARSKLYASVLDTLHRNGVEIMSPTFMNQRQLSEKEKIIPQTTAKPKAEKPTPSAEDIAFDKAEKAEQLENEKKQIKQEIENLDASLKEASDEEEKKAMQESIKQLQERLKALEETPKEEENGSGKAEADSALEENSGSRQ